MLSTAHASMLHHYAANSVAVTSSKPRPVLQLVGITMMSGLSLCTSRVKLSTLTPINRRDLNHRHSLSRDQIRVVAGGGISVKYRNAKPILQSLYQLPHQSRFARSDRPHHVDCRDTVAIK